MYKPAQCEGRDCKGEGIESGVKFHEMSVQVRISNPGYLSSDVLSNQAEMSAGEPLGQDW